LIDMIEPDRMTPKALSDWMATDLPPLRLNGRLDLNGLDRLPLLAAQILGKASAPEFEEKSSDVQVPALAVS
jgi:predicted glycosyltransferase